MWFTTQPVIIHNTSSFASITKKNSGKSCDESENHFLKRLFRANTVLHIISSWAKKEIIEIEENSK